MQAVSADLQPLSQAILASDYRAVEAALRSGASPNIIDPAVKHSPLYLAVAPGGPRDAEVVSLLARSGAETDALDPYSQLTPLMAAMVVTETGPFAVIEGAKATQLVGQLLQLGADPNRALAKGESPLMVATGLGNLPMVKTLLANGANVRAKDQQGTTALHIAFETGQSADLRNTLLAAGADPSALDASGRKPGEAKPVSTPVAEPTPPPNNASSTPEAAGTAPQAEKPSNINKWLIGGAVVAAAVLGAVALSKYTEEEKRRKANEVVTATLTNVPSRPPVASPPKPPADRAPIPIPPVGTPPSSPPEAGVNLVFDKSTLTFGPQDNLTTSAAQTVTLTNHGPGAAVLATSSITLPLFAQWRVVSNNCPMAPQKLSAGTSCTVAINFSPRGDDNLRASHSLALQLGGNPAPIPPDRYTGVFEFTANSYSDPKAIVPKPTVVLNGVGVYPPETLRCVAPLVLSQGKCVTPPPVGLNGTWQYSGTDRYSAAKCLSMNGSFSGSIKLVEDSAGVVTDMTTTSGPRVGKRTGNSIVMNKRSTRFGFTRAENWQWDGANTVTGVLTRICYNITTNQFIEAIQSPFTATRY